MNKKVFTIVIIILLIVLWAQLYYYAHSSDAEKTSIPNSYDFTNDGSQIENELASASTQLQTMNDNYSLVFGQYNGPVTQNEFSVYVDSLINYKMKDLYTKLERKSTNDIKLYYDRHTNEIADYNIYSGEELVNVYNELCQVNWNRKHICISKNIKMDKNLKVKVMNIMIMDILLLQLILIIQMDIV